ncbi:PREDICTED: probable membrane-associated kinase regulator 2 isoform X2 [Ipomoea nil]|uniref:probable membrane-associated kinase regulator 2 isoform X2 n=1 Tax=Ipomoea nil TaxID=35883 RepID=UPI000900B11A|nr:PREDICTED: probable membrane-associated kinase regulator 2 isoform X2 [Ipomoea nil]
MEAFSLLKYWRGGGGGNTFSAADAGFSSRSTDSSTAGATTIVTTVSPHFTDSDSDFDSDTEDGPFFDLEFTVPEDEDGDAKAQTGAGENEDKTVDAQHSEIDDGGDSDDSDDENEEGELKLTFSPSSASNVDRSDANASLSPRDDLFFKGRLVPVEHASLTLTASEANSKFPVSFLKSATKFRVMMLKLKKPKANAHRSPEKSEPKSKPCPKRKASRNEKDEEAQIRAEKKSFTVKLKVEEVKIKSLFTRESSSKGNNNGKAEQKPNTLESHLNSSSSSEERKFPKETIQKYLKLVKPLYIRVSKRYSDKLGFSGHLSFPGGGTAAAATTHSPPPQSTAEKAETEPTDLSEKAAVLNNAKSQKQGNLPAGLRVVPKNLMKSRSASSAAAAAAASPVSSSQRRDDSLIEQHDGIQGAILHCKRSFNASRGRKP